MQSSSSSSSSSQRRSTTRMEQHGEGPLIRTTRVVTTREESSSSGEPYVVTEPLMRTTRVVTREESSSSSSGEPVVRTTRVVSSGEPIVRTTRIVSSGGEPVVRTTRVVTSSTREESSSGEPVVRTTRVVTSGGEPVVQTRVVTTREESSSGEPLVHTRVVTSREEPSVRTTRVVTSSRENVREDGGSSPILRTRVTSREGSGDSSKSRDQQANGRTVHTTRVVKKISSPAGVGNKTVTETTVTSKAAAAPHVRTVTRTTTKLVASPTKKSKISDIITGSADETLSVREALLKWAKRTTERYPGVRITDFTNSFKDGLAFCAILHRNRPDILDFRSLRARNAKENLELAFSLAEKEFGITRLLDPEDVDTPDPDERSLITYISSFYDVFPEPPSHHPFADDEINRKVEEYKELSRSLQEWMLQTLNSFKSQRNIKTLIDMKALLLESSKFRSDELSKRQREKERLNHLSREIQKLSRHTSPVTFPKDLQIEVLEKTWNQVSSSLQERDQKVKDEISRLEKLQRLAEKFNKESKLFEGKIDDIERRISEEEKRIQRLHLVDAKHNCEQIENDLKSLEDVLKGLEKDFSVLRDKNYPQLNDLKNRLDSLKDKFKVVKSSFNDKMAVDLAEKSDKSMSERKVSKTRNTSSEKVAETPKQNLKIKDHFDWIERKLKRIESLEYGTDHPSIKSNLEQIKVEQKAIEQYQKKITSLVAQKNSKDLDNASAEDIEKLEKDFKNLVSISSKKQQDLESFLDFVQTASRELKWMSDKENTEIARDWSAKNLNISQLEHHQETLTSDLEKREVQFNAVQSRGENLLRQLHPASKCIDGYLKNLQNKWSWLLQLTFCLEVHLRSAQAYEQFFKEARELEQFLKTSEDKLNSVYNKSSFSVDEGEKFIKQMEDMKDNLTKYNGTLNHIVTCSKEVVPLKLRRLQPSKPLPVVSICSYKSSDGSISKDEKCILKEITPKYTWKLLTSNGKEVSVPSVCFTIPPPNTEAVELADNLKKRYEDLLNLWTQRQKKLRQNLVFATIKIVKSWDMSKCSSMEISQRESIMKALNADAEKLVNEGTESDPALVKLKQDIQQCNTQFVSSKKTTENGQIETVKNSTNAGKTSPDNISNILNLLNEKEKVLKNKLQTPILWDLDSLESSVLEHKEFDIELRALDDQVTEIIEAFKSPNMRVSAINNQKYETVIQTWDKIWELSNLYIEKLKIVEVALNQLSDLTQSVSNIEVKLASCENMPSKLGDMREVHEKLLSFQEEMQASQSLLDDTQETSTKLKEFLRRIKSKQSSHTDLNKYENNLKKLTARLDKAKTQVVERLRSCGASSELLQSYKSKINDDSLWISQTTVKMNSLKSVKTMTTKEIEMTVEPAMNLYSEISEKGSSFDETNVLGARYLREAKAAVEENYKVCEENNTKLKTWMKDLEVNLASVGAVEEELPNLHHQITVVKTLKLDLENQHSLITTCVDQMRQLAQRGLEVLNKEEINYLQKNLISLRTQYDSLLHECDRLLKRLTSAYEELHKYKSETKLFKEWLNEAQKKYQDIVSGIGVLPELGSKSELIRSFTSDVIAHQADLRFITMAAQKFIAESQDYLKAINSLRTNLRQKMPLIKVSDSQIKAEVQQVTTVFHNFLNEVNKFSDNYTLVCSKYSSYVEAADKAKSWISDIKKSSKKVINEPVADEPSAVQSQLDKIKLINMEVVGQGRIIENVFQSVKLLTDTLEICFIAPSEGKIIESTLSSLQNEYSNLLETIAKRIQELQIALIQSQDIQGGLERISKWLEETETSVKEYHQPISLITDKLDRQVQDYKILKSDIDNQKQSIEMLTSSAKNISTEANPKLARKVDAQLKDISTRFEKLCDKTSKQLLQLEEVSENVHLFEEIVLQFDEWCVATSERIDTSDSVHRTDIDGFISIVDYLINQRESKRQDYEQIRNISNSLVSRKDVTDAKLVKEKISKLEKEWKCMEDKLNEKRLIGKARSEQMASYESLRIKVLEWLLETERNFEKLEPLSLDPELLKKQTTETSGMLKIYSDYSSTVEKLNQLGNTSEYLVKDGSRGKLDSPIKKPSSPIRKSPSKSRSTENFVVSPIKTQVSAQSPLSTISSGFSSRSSSDNIGGLDDMTPAEQQLSEINDRYSLLGAKMSNRSQEAATISEEVKSIFSAINLLSIFIESKQKLLPKEGPSQSKETIENHIMILKEIEKEMFEKQTEVENVKVKVHAILSQRKEAKGSTAIEDKLHNFEDKWNSVSNTIKSNLVYLENEKEYKESILVMKNWLTQKEKMFEVLGPIASEPRMVTSQVQQVQVMREEFNSQKSFLERLISLSSAVNDYLKKNGVSTNKINVEMEEIEKQWSDMYGRLIQREKNLEAASGVTKDFHKSLIELQGKIQQIGDKFDSLEEKNTSTEKLLKKLTELEEDLDKLRPQLADAVSVSEQLCDILSDSASKSEIKYKVNILEKTYNALRKKIDNKKAEIESSINEDKEFLKTCDDINAWLSSKESAFKCLNPLSASVSKLMKETEEFEVLYKEIMDKEHEVYLCLSKGSDMLTKVSGKQELASLKTKLDNVKKFHKLKNNAIDRRTCLQKCLENCKKYETLVNSFSPWLESIEGKCKGVKPTILKREEINKKLKEMQGIKSELSIHHQEFQNVVQLGELILTSCEVDEGAIKKQLSLFKKKWQDINSDVILKMQSFEDLSQVLLEYEEQFRDVEHGVQRLEDKMCSHDAIGDVSCDPVLLERLNTLLQEATLMKEEINKLYKFSKLVIEKCKEDLNTSDLMNNLEAIKTRHETLSKDLELRCATLKSTYKVISVFMEQMKSLRLEVNNLDEAYDKMQPIARDLKTLKEQLKEVKEFKSNLMNVTRKFSTSETMYKNITKENISDTRSYMEQINYLSRQITRLEEHVTERETNIENVTTRIESFERTLNEINTKLKKLLKMEESFEVNFGDVDAVRSQQDKLKELHVSEVVPLSKLILEANKLSQGLVQSSASCVDTSEIEQKMDAVNTSWSNLQISINEKEKKLDIALLQSGKFKEALCGVEKWLIDTEELVANQKPPSSDYKVLRAQVQEQKFLKKMLLDRQNSVVSLKAMGTELKSSTKSSELKQNEKLMKNISTRFDELILTAEKRMKTLESTIPVAQEFQNMSNPLMEWLENIEKRLSSLSTVPLDEQRIKDMLSENKKLSKEIVNNQKSLQQINSIAVKLKKIINNSESDSLDQKVKSINQHFVEIEESNKNIDTSLNEAMKGIGNFSTTYTKVMTFLERTSIHLTDFQVLSIYTDKLQNQVKDLQTIRNELTGENTDIRNVVVSGEKIMKIASGEDSIQLKEKLDSLTMKLSEMSNKLNERLKTAEESLPLVESFYSAIQKLTTWMDSVESSLKVIDGNSLDIQSETIKKLEEEILKHRSVLDVINNTGPRLCQLSAGEGAVSIENQISRANQRFEKICEQVQRKAERIQLTRQRKYDIISDIDELFEWFDDIQNQITNAEGLSLEPNILSVLLKEQKTLCDDLNSQKNKVREVITTAKKLMRESTSEDLSYINEKMEKLKSHSIKVSTMCQERLSALEQALALAKHFFETHSDLGQWLDEIEGETDELKAPALNPLLIKKQQEKNKDLSQSVQEHKPLVDKLNKTGSALTKLCKDDESEKLEIILESDNSRYNALRKILREHQNALEEALQATSQFSDKLEGILNALTSTADQLHNAEPISAHPERIQEQINDNKAVLQDLDKRTITLEAVKRAADDVITRANIIDEPAVKDIKVKLDRLNDLWVTIQTAAQNRGKSLEEALVAAEKFWDELTAVMKALKELQGNLKCQDPPAVEPTAVQQQQEVLLEIKQEITQTKPEVDHCRQAGQNLMQLCGEPDKPDVKKHIEDLDSAWENVTTLYAKREQNLIDAMEKAMVFHDTLQNLLEFLDTFEEKFSKLGPVSSDIESVKSQINQLKAFKTEVDPHMIEVEALNRQAQELMERTTSDQAVSIREPLGDINKRWEDLLKCIVERQKEMESTLLKLGQFQHALEEHMLWMSKTEKTLDGLKPVFGDPQVIEVVLAKHKVISNDIQAHQSSIDAINRAGHEFVNSGKESEDAKGTHNKLKNLMIRWQQLQDKSAERNQELEEALREAQLFHQDIQDFLMWLNEIDGLLATTKPVGGLPETAREELNKFMDLFNEMDANRYKIENIMQKGQSYVQKSENSTKTLQHSLKTLKQKWDSVLNKANDRKIKLEIALREATEFHEALQSFVEWLTNAEKYLSGLKPVSRYMKAVLEQIEEHRNFQRDLGSHREVMLNLDKKGTHLKYFSQKQDVILIKNLLISVQHRWEKVVSKAAERTRALDHGYKESKEFHDSWTSLSTWLDEAEKLLDSSTPIGNDPKKIKKLLTKHKEFQRTLGSKQGAYDSTMKSGRLLKDRCPKPDVELLQEMIDELKTRWTKICSKAVDRQRKLEEALLYSGQFKEAVIALMDWFDKAITSLSEVKPYHGDLDTVTSLIELHKSFEEELKNRGLSLESVVQTSEDLKNQASSSDLENISSQINDLKSKFTTVSSLSEEKKKNLTEALQLAEKLYKLVHILLEWLSDAEMKLRFFGSLPDDEELTKKQISEHNNFLKEMESKEILKNETLEIAQDILQKCHPDAMSVIRHWITVIQSRWDEISTWTKQRDQRLHDHLISLRDLNDLLEQLLSWLINAESSLTKLEAEPLPEDLTELDTLIKEHQVFMNDMSKKQSDVEKISKAFSSKRHQNKGSTSSQVKEKSKEREKFSRSSTPTSKSTIRSEADSDIKNPRAKLLLEKWRIVWLLAMERLRRLQDRNTYLHDLDKIQHFDFNDWRSRYLGWLNNKKSRIMDQYKKIDKNNTGKITKQEFIEGTLKSRFVTNRLEMERVVDIFDRNHDGFIDTKEYLETLRPEKEGGPKTEAEQIEHEVQRQVAKCTCVQRFKVYQVGEGKYRFGESQKLRLVRILRSTVMVRVGGGWVDLDEFLVKNDPCRAKGRTNLELREQFILADGVSQSMTPFKPKLSPNSPVPSQSGATNTMSSTGPITKIREKSERSTPMRHSRSSIENSSDISGPSFSETDTFSNKSSVSRTTPSRLSTKNLSSRPSSRPSSRQGSQFSSRAPSDLSQDGVEDYKTRRKQTVGNGVGQKTLHTTSLEKTSKVLPETKIPSVKKSPKQPSNQEYEKGGNSKVKSFH